MWAIQVDRRGSQSDKIWEEFNPLLLYFKMELESHEKSNVHGLQTVEKARKWILPESFQKGSSPADTLTLALWTHVGLLT